MTRQLVLVHGRSQQQKDAVALKAEWMDALMEGLGKSNLTLPIPENDVRFPFYGDTLYDLIGGKAPEEAAKIVVRGQDTEAEQKRFTRAILDEIRQRAGITEQQLAEVEGQDVIHKGPQNWEWFQGVLKAIDRYLPLGSGASIALFTNDVYQYLKNSAIRHQIEDGITKAIEPGVETVVVGHSLGTVVSYNLLRREGHLRGWKVPLFVTLGSPLAIKEIRRSLQGFAPPTRCPECVHRWFNAMDERDVVALYPLFPEWFPLEPQIPAIENQTDIRNRTENRHGITGYLDDQEVAKRIYDALIA